MNLTPQTATEFEQSLVLRGRSPHTAAKYGRVAAAFIDWSSDQEGDDVADAFAAWLLECRTRTQIAAGTVRMRIAAGRALCDHLGVPRGPLASYKLPPLPEPVPHPVPGGTVAVRKMIAACTTEHQRNAVALGALAGLRVSETVSVTRDAIQTRHHGADEYQVIKVRGKGEREREVPVSRELAAYIETMPESGRLVPLSNNGARTAIRRASRAAGVQGHDGGEVSSHDLRATFATEVHGRTRDIVLVQRLLGHSSVTTTQVYVGTSVADTRAGVEF